MSLCSRYRKIAEEKGYKVVSSTLGHVAMDRRCKWFTPAYKEERTAWQAIFEHLSLSPLPSKEEKEQATGGVLIDFKDMNEEW